MLNTEDIRNKEVINIYDGKSMGFVRLFGKETNDYVIKWKHIRIIGEDIILVDVPPVPEL